MNRILQAICAVLRSFRAVLKLSTRWVGGALVTASETVWEATTSTASAASEVAISASEASWNAAVAVPGVALKAVSVAGSVAAGLASDVVRFPLRAVGTLARAVLGGGGGGGQGGEQASAAEAAERTARDQAAAEAASELRCRIQAIRRIAGAVKRGARPPEDAVAALPGAVVDYLVAMSPSEAAAVVTSPSAKVQTLLEVAEPAKTAPAKENSPAAPRLVRDRIEARRARAESLVAEYA